METLTERLQRVGKQASVNKQSGASDGKPDSREQAIIDKHTGQVPGVSFLQKAAKGMAAMEIDTRRQQRQYAEQAPAEAVEPVREMLSNLGDRSKVLEVYRNMTPAQRQEALRLAPGVAQQLGDDRGGVIGRTLGAVSRGTSHGVSQPLMEMTGTGGSNDEIDYIRQLDAAAAQEFHPSRPGDPWYQRGPLQALEMAPWMATVIGATGLGRVATANVAGRVATSAAAGNKIAGAVQKAGQAVSKLPQSIAGKVGISGVPAIAAGDVGALAGTTAASIPPQYAQEVDQLKQIGMEDGPKLRMLALGTAAISGMLEGIVPNPFKTGPVPLTEGAVKAARQYLWEAAKNAPGEMSEEYLQGVASGLGKHVAQYLDQNAEDKSIEQAFQTGWDQAKEAALPMAFLLGAPAVGGATASAAQASRLKRLQEIRAKGFVSAEDAASEGIAGKNRKERLANADAEIKQLSEQPPEEKRATVAKTPTFGGDDQQQTQPPLQVSQPPQPLPPSTPPADPATQPGTAPAAGSPVNQQETGKEPEQPKSDVVSTFQTSSGSTYELHADGSTTRNRAERGDGYRSGPQRRSSKTWFVDEGDLKHIAGPSRFPGDVTLRETTNDKGEPRLSQYNVKHGTTDEGIKFSTEPKPGMVPVEYWDDQTTIHYGNKIVEPTKQPKPAAQPSATPDAGKPSSFEEYANEWSSDLAKRMNKPVTPLTDAARKSLETAIENLADEGIKKGRVTKWETDNTKLDELQLREVQNAVRRKGYEPADIKRSTDGGVDYIGFDVTKKKATEPAPQVTPEQKPATQPSQSSWDVVQGSDGKLYRENPNAKTAAERGKTRQPVEPSEGAVLVTKDRFGKPIPPETFKARQEFADKAKPGAEFEHSDYKGQAFKVLDDGTLMNSSGRKMGDVQAMVNTIKPGAITWKETPSTAGPSEETGKTPTVSSTASPDAPAAPETSMGKTAGEKQSSEARADDTVLPKGAIGRNAKGEPVFEDENGVRSVGSVTESVGMRPVRTPNGGITYQPEVDTANREDRFKTTDETELESDRTKAQELWDKHGKKYLEDTYKRDGLKDTAADKKRREELRSNVEGSLTSRPKSVINVLSEYEPKPPAANDAQPSDATPAADQPSKSEALTDGFKALPPQGQAAFETEWAKGGTSIKNLLYPNNKNYRAEFEARTGIKLPKGVGSTFQAVEDWHNAGRPLAPNTASGSTAPQPESKWHTEARSKLEAVPAFKGAKIEPDEKTGTVRVTRQDGLATTIHLDADEKLAEAAKKIGRKQLYGLYFRKNGETEGRIYIHSKANHSNILNHEVMHWLEDQGVVTKEEVAQHGGQEAIAEKYGKWASLKQRKKDTVLQKIYDALEPVFSSQARFFEEVGNRQKATSQEDESARIAKLRADAAKAMLRGDTEMADALNRQANDLEKEPQTQENLSEDKKSSTPQPPAGYKPLAEFKPDVIETKSPDLEMQDNLEDIKLLKLKKGEAVGYRVYPKKGSKPGGYWQYGTVKYEPSGSHASIELADGTVESVGGSRLIRLEPTQASADQVNVDSGEESKVNPDFKQNDRVEVTHYGRVLKGRVYSVNGSEPGTVLVELDNRVGNPQEYLVENVKVVSGEESKGKQTAEKPNVSPIGDTSADKAPAQSTFDDGMLDALDAILQGETPKQAAAANKPEMSPIGDKTSPKAKSGQFALPGMPGMAAEIDRQDFVRLHRNKALEALWGWSSDPADAGDIQGAIDTMAPSIAALMNEIYAGKFKDIDEVYDSEVYAKVSAASKGTEIDAMEVLDGFDKSIEQALADRPKKSTGKKPLKSEQTLAEAKTDMQAALDAAADLLKDIRKSVKLLSTFDPELGAKTIRVAYMFTKAGIKTFKGYVEAIVEHFGEAVARELAPYMESGWRALNTRGIVKDAAGKVGDYLTEQPNADTTRNDDSEVMGEDTSEPSPKPKKRRKAGKVSGDNQQSDTGDRGNNDGAGSGSTEDSGGNRDGVSSPAGSLNNHQIAERPDWLEGGAVAKLNRNIDAITTMNRVEAENRTATPEEQAIIARYTGWGHLKQFFIRDSDLRAIKAVQGDKWNLNAFKSLDAHTEEQIRAIGKRKGDSDEKIEAKIQREKANNKHRVRLATSMNPKEYEQARKSTRYSHYTDPAIARSMWEFIREALPEAGKIRVLEPSEGSGMFWGTMPDSLFNRAEMHGIDMDPASSRVSKHLYPSVRHLNIPFQQAPYPKEFFDLAVTNVPFNKNPVQDPNADFDSELSLHNYFFAKTAGQVREGGLVVFITTHFTMDAASAKQRSVITNQGLKFLGAVRLNQDAFGNVANTKVTTDVIVMQKVAPGSLESNNSFERDAVPIVAPMGEETASLNVHPYFGDKPSMVAGKITANGEMRGAGPELTVESEMTPEETAQFIKGALAKIAVDKQAFIEGQKNRKDIEDSQQGATTLVPEHLKNLGIGTLAIDGNRLVVKTSSETMSIVKADFSPTLKARAEKWFAVRDALKNLQRLQTHPDNPESDIEDARKELNRVYDDFVGKFDAKKNDYDGYKPLNTTYNKSMFAADYMSATVEALENTKLVPTGELDKDGKEKMKMQVSKASIFTERTEWPLEHRPKPKTVKEALANSMFTNGGVDIDWIASTLGKSKAEVSKQLEKYAFEVPNDGGWEINEVYLSGNIAKKLEIAEEAAAKNPAFTRNVDALRDVLPVPKTFEQLTVYPNSPFIPVDTLRAFVTDTLGLGAFELYRNDQELGGGWRANYDRRNELNETTQDLEQYAVKDGRRVRKRGFDLFLDMIAGKPTIILDTDADDRTYVNEALTNLAKSKRMDLARAFDTFIRSSQDRMDAVTNEFNRLLSGYVKPSIPEWVVSFDGMSSNWKDLMRSYQKEAAAKIAMGGNTLLAHRVGYGKTLSGVAGIMEQRRLGAARKPIAVVPNHLTGQWAKAFADFYPSAKVMAPTAKDFDKQHRQATMNRIMTGNWDAVIVPESSFKKLPMSSEYVEEFFQKQISQAIDAAERARAEGGADPRTIAELEDVTERLRNQLAKYLAEAQKDPGPFFDEMGIDSLTVDEAHHYKNLPFYTQNTRVAGINPTGSQQAFDMLMKTDFINALTGSRNVTFLTGTPIANSMTEAWVMMRYLMPEAMKEANVFAFDDWKNAFGEVVDRTRVNTIGTGFRTESRFQKFVNLDVLAKMFQQVADIQMINNDVQVPPIKGGKPQSIVVPASDAMKNFMLGLAARSANMPQDPSEDNMLNVMTVGAGAAIDFRLLDAAAMPSETSKITVAADEVTKIFKLTTPFKGTQIIWADRGVPKAAKKLTAEMKQLGAWMLEEIQSRPLTMEEVKEKWKEMRPNKNAAKELQRFMGMALQDMNYTTGNEEDEVSYRVDIPDEPTVWVNEITDVDPNITEQAAPPWNVYQQMKDELVSRGIPADQIVFIHDYKTAAQKVQLWEKMNNGDVRVLMGNTPRLGTGANIQVRLVAAHHLDVPWRPSDVEQRDGRIIRSGNRVITIGSKIGFAEQTGVDLDGVIINRYVTEGSIDARYWDTDEMKAQMLQDFWSGNPGVSIEELGATTLSMSDVKAAAVANPLLKRKIELEHEVEKLSEEYRGAVQSRTQTLSRLRDAKEEVPEAKNKLETAKARVAWWNEGKASLPEGENFGVEIDGKTLYRRDDIAKAIDKKLHEISRDIPLEVVKSDASDWAKTNSAGSAKPVDIGKVFGKPIRVIVEGGFRNPETGEVVGGNTWQQKQLAKELKDGKWEKSYREALFRIGDIDEVARLGTNPQGFAARLRNFAEPSETWIQDHERALASKEKALAELQKLADSIPEPDSSKLNQLQQELEEVSNAIGEEDDDQIAHWVATEELERVLGADTLHEQLGRVDSTETLLGYINHPDLGNLSVFNRSGDTRPPAHAMVWIEGNNATIGYKPRDEKGVMGLPILKPRRQLGTIQHPDHGELLVFNHKEGDVAQPGKVWVESEDGSKSFGYQDKDLNVVMAVEMQKIEKASNWPEEVKQHTDKWHKNREIPKLPSQIKSGPDLSPDANSLDAFTSPELQKRQSIGAARLPIASAADLVGDDDGAPGSQYASPDEEFERRWRRASKGIGKKTLATKLREFWTEIVKSTVRGSLPELPRSERFGEARSAMHAYQNAPAYAQMATADLLKKTSKPLSASDYDLFTRIVIMRDQVEAASKGERLSYGLTPETATAELERVEALAEDNERVQASLEYRKQWTEAMVDDFLAAHQFLGWDMSDRFQRENYFRHQVLYYMEAEQRGLGKKKVALTPNRSWLKGRTSGEDLGEEFDINANYLQAEWEVATQMIADTKRAQAIGRLKSHYDMMQQLKERAKRNNYIAVVGGSENMAEIEDLRAKIEELRAAGSLDSDERAQIKEWSERIWELDPTMPFRRDMAIARDEIERGARSIGEEVPDDFMRYVASLAKQEDSPLNGPALAFLKAVSDRKAFIKQALGEDYETWEDVIPDDYEEVAIRPGRAMFQAYSVPEQVASELMADLSKTLGISAEDLRPLTALGAKYTPLVVPMEVAAQMAAIDNTMDFGWLDRVVTRPMRAWKQWVLMSPTRFIKYNLRNLSEIDKVMALNPAALKEVPQAINDLWKLYSGADDIPANVRDWVERGGSGTLVRINEVGEINELKAFARLIAGKKSGVIGKVMKAPADLWRTYWEKVGIGSDFRESILRYAAYLNYLKQLEDGHLTNYGGSVRSEVNGIQDNRDKAMRLSADLLGDYSDISIVGQFMRSRIAPFWAFQETNVRTYFRGLINLASNEQSAIRAGMKIARAAGVGGLAQAPFLAYKLGRIAILFYGLKALSTALNQLLFPDDDDELPNEEKRKAHLTFGKNSKGEVQYFSRIGTAADVLDWVGLDSVDYDLRDVLDGRRTVREVLMDMARSPLDKAYGMLSPFMKVPTELAVGQTAYPSVGKPRPIRDRGRYIAQTLGVQKEYDKLAGNPSTPYSVSDLILYKVEPGASAYYMTQDAKFRWLKEARNRGIGYSDSVRGNALRNYKMALRLNDQVAVDKYLAEYVAAGGTQDGLLESMEWAHPAGGLSTIDTYLFYKSLSPIEQEEYKNAERFYYSELLTEEQANTIRKRRHDRLKELAIGTNEDDTPKGRPNKKDNETNSEYLTRLNEWKHERSLAKEALELFSKQ